MHNEQPFYIGQKVVCVDELQPWLSNGNIYTIEEVIQCPTCKLWHVTISELAQSTPGIFICAKCEWVEIKLTLNGGTRASRFAPLHYASITASLAQDAVQERLDVVKVKEVEGV